MRRVSLFFPEMRELGRHMADIEFNCPYCDQDIVMDEEGIGRSFRCPGCQKTIMVPEARACVADPKDVEFNCLHCDQEIVVDRAGIGRQFLCPGCQRTITVPEAGSSLVEINDIEFKCRHCDQDIVVHKRGAGKEFLCPGCQQTVRVPAGKSVDAPPTISTPITFAVVEVCDDNVEKPMLQQEQGLMGRMLGSTPATTGKIDEEYTSDMASDSLTSPDVLKRFLSYGRHDLVSCLAVANPSCPVDLIINAARKAASVVDAVGARMVIYALRNPNLPSRTLSELAQNPRAMSFSEAIFQHPHMDAKTLSEMEPGADDDLLSLIVRAAVCPAELVNRVALGERKKRSTLVATQSAKCTAETLIKTLSGFACDNISFSALKNVNCPPEMVSAILIRNEDDQISRWAAQGDKCDQATIARVLARNQLDKVSKLIAGRSDCPKDERLSWKTATGQMTMPKVAGERQPPKRPSA